MRRLIDLITTHLAEDRYEDGRAFWLDVRDHAHEKSAIEVPSWPLSPIQLRDLERTLLQTPEWIAYWARFDWRSWTQATDYHFDRHDNLFVFQNVPQISYHDGVAKPDRASLKMRPDGSVVEDTSRFAEFYAYLPMAVEACRQVVRIAAPKLRFLQGTYYIRFGMWPKDERSQNFINYKQGDTPVYEAGVSAYHGHYDIEHDRWAIDVAEVYDEAVSGTMQTLISGKRTIYLVQGTEISELGADGEPLLHDVRLIATLKPGSVYIPGIYDPLLDD